jgi:hypothetical protein
LRVLSARLTCALFVWERSLGAQTAKTFFECKAFLSSRGCRRPASQSPRRPLQSAPSHTTQARTPRSLDPHFPHPLRSRAPDRSRRAALPRLPSPRESRADSRRPRTSRASPILAPVARARDMPQKALTSRGQQETREARQEGPARQLQLEEGDSEEGQVRVQAQERRRHRASLARDDSRGEFEE